jgi:late competence protein required for DNA uptake (superfamily II DNA/RNA helicase)
MEKEKLKSTKISKKKIKCKKCNKKLHLLLVDMYTCKCNQLYCSNHLLDHDCTFNYINANKSKLYNLLVKVNKQKITKF